MNGEKPKQIQMCCNHIAITIPINWVEQSFILLCSPVNPVEIKTGGQTFLLKNIGVA